MPSTNLLSHRFAMVYQLVDDRRTRTRLIRKDTVMAHSSIQILRSENVIIRTLIREQQSTMYI